MTNRDTIEVIRMRIVVEPRIGDEHEIGMVDSDADGSISSAAVALAMNWNMEKSGFREMICECMSGLQSNGTMTILSTTRNQNESESIPH